MGRWLSQEYRLEMKSSCDKETFLPSVESWENGQLATANLQNFTSHASKDGHGNSMKTAVTL